MSVVELDRPWTDLPFPLQGLTIEDEFEIQILQKYCDYVYIEHDYTGSLDTEDESLGSLPPSSNKPNDTSNRKAYKLQPKTELNSELVRAHTIYLEARKFMEQIFTDARVHKKVDAEKAKVVIRKCIASIVSNANALFWLTRIQSTSQVEADHGLRVAVLSIALGHSIGMDSNQLERLGTAALLHDIGKSQIPEDILNKSATLTDAERRVMERHTSLGFELLNADPTLASAIKDVALNHHQRPDGLGYPVKLRYKPLSLFTRIVSIVDSYDDMTHQISHVKAISPRLALKEIYEYSGKQFDEKLAKAFIKMVGIYPAGSIVKMTNGQVAMVVSTDPERKLSPKVELIYDKNGNILSPVIIDLKESIRDINGDLYKIAGSLPDSSLGMDMSNYIVERLNISTY